MCVSVYFFLLDHVLFRFELMMMMMVSPVGDFKHLNTFRSDFKSIDICLGIWLSILYVHYVYICGRCAT